MAKIRIRDIVVLLPGITGSVLRKDDKDLWAISGQAAWQALTSVGSSLQQLMLEEDNPEVDEIGDGIRATRLISDAHLVPGLVKIDGYSLLSRLITDNFAVIHGHIDGESPANFFEFPYDWRRDNRVAARLLKQLIDQRLPQWRKHSGAVEAKVILLAHSMGGLVARYYLEVLEGWQDCRALVTFGTPYRGSINALHYLANGYKKLFLDLTEVMRSFTSTYQLLPIYSSLEDIPRARLSKLIEYTQHKDNAVQQGALTLCGMLADCILEQRSRYGYAPERSKLRSLRFDWQIGLSLIGDVEATKKRQGITLLTLSDFPITDVARRTELLTALAQAQERGEITAWARLLREIPISKSKELVWRELLESILAQPRAYSSAILAAAMERYAILVGKADPNIIGDETAIGLPAVGR